MSLHSVDLNSAESLRAHMERMRHEFQRVRQQDLQTIRALEKRAKRAEAGQPKRMSAKEQQKRLECQACGRICGMYMLHNELWAAIVADTRTRMLCIWCAEKWLGRALVQDDFRKLPVNDLVLWALSKER